MCLPLQPAIDIELCLLGANTIDVGVFAPLELLSLDGAQMLVGEFARELSFDG